MDQTDKGLAAKVGAFVFVGLVILGILVVQFGRLNEGFKTYYSLTVHLPNASGLLKSSDVLMAGAKIGRVAGGPRLLPAAKGVAVPLRIFDYVKIPIGSKFTVGSSGLLGDRYVAVSMPKTKPTGYLTKGAVIEGGREAGLSDVTREGKLLIGDLRDAVKNVDTTITRLNEKALSPANLENLKGSIAHLNEATSSLAESSKKIDGVIETADAAMTEAKEAAGDVQVAIADARKTFQSATAMVNEATSGDGFLATLLKDEELSSNLRALIANLRKHGVLFYRDSAVTPLRPEESAPRRSRDRRPSR